MAEETAKDEKTEEATPRKAREAREKGQVAMSTELIAAVSLVTALGIFIGAGGRLFTATATYVASISSGLEDMATTTLDPVAASQYCINAILSVAAPLALFVVPLFFVGALGGYGQAGFQLSPKAVAFDPSKLNPIKGLERMFSTRTLVRTSLAAAKIFVIGSVIGILAWSQIPKLSGLAGTDLGPAVGAIVTIAIKCVTGAIIAILALALIDFAFQRYQHTKDLRMSKKEVKEEMKSMEGDPHLKARVRQIQREMATRRMMDDVPDATVVITNPTHFAVALRYDRDSDTGQAMGAPMVVAKGVDSMALRIRKVAKDAGVVVVENKPLARGLHAATEIGDPIPEDFYSAVAEVLTYVYRLQGELATSPGGAL